MNINDLVLLIEVAERLSFAQVARRHNIDPSMVSRSIANIERQLGFAIFHRTTRKMSLTGQGQIYVQTISPLIEELQHAKSKAQIQHQIPSGTVRLTTSTAFGNQIILPLVKQFTTHLPQIDLQLNLTDQNLDLLDHQMDLAIRLTDKPTGDLICTKLMDTRYYVVTAPDFDIPLNHPTNLSCLNCPLLDLPKYRDDWQFKNANTQLSVKVNGNIRMSNPLALREAARLGIGPALLPDWMVSDDIASGRLVRHLSTWQVTATNFETAAWLIYPPQKFIPARLRATIDLLCTHIRGT